MGESIYLFLVLILALTTVDRLFIFTGLSFVVSYCFLVCGFGGWRWVSMLDLIKGESKKEQQR